MRLFLNSWPPKSESNPNHPKHSILVLLLYLIIGYLIYSNILDSHFIADDYVLLHNAKHMTFFESLIHLYRIFFRPLVSAAIDLIYPLFSLSSIYYHVLSIALHIANAFLVYLITWRILCLTISAKESAGSNLFIISVSAGLFFLLLHNHSEAVSWFSAISDLLATLFLLLSFYNYLSYTKKRLILSLLFFLLAIGCKLSVIIYPFILICFEVYFYFIIHSKNYPKTINKKRFAPRLKIPGLFLGIILFYFMIKYIIYGSFLGGYGDTIHLDLSLNHLFYQLISFSYRSLLPNFTIETMGYLHIIKEWLSLIEDHIWIFILGIASILLLVLGITSIRQFLKENLIQKWRNPLIPLLILLIVCFYISLLPVLNIGIDLLSSQGERFLYFPTFFTSLIIVLIIFLICKKWYLILPMIILMLISSGWILYRSNQNWKTAGEIFQHTINRIMEDQSKPMVLLSLPDNYNGAYIFRDGLNYAIEMLSQQENPPFPMVVSRIYFYHPELQTQLSRQGQAYLYEINDPHAYFIQPQKIKDLEPYETPEFKLELNSIQSMQWIPDPVFDNYSLFYFQEDQLISVK